MPNTLSDQSYDVIADHLSVSEEEIRWPYLDTKGHITIGIGFKIDNGDAFAALDLTTEKDGKVVPATDNEKRAAYRRMEEIREEMGGDLNKKANFYDGKTSIFMSPDAIDKKFHNEIQTRTEKIRKEIGDKAWNKLNDTQKAAVIDIDYTNGDGGLKGFPELKKAIIKGDGKAMADQSTFYTNKEKGERHLERLQRNYKSLSGLEPEASDKALAELLEKQAIERQKTEDKKEIAEEAQSPDGALDTSHEPMPKDEADDETAPTETEALTTEEDSDLRKLIGTLTQSVDTVDEALLKDDLTEAELKALMKSEPYRRSSDLRHKQTQNRVKRWFDDHWGAEPARVDATGRIAPEEKPRIPFPLSPERPTEPMTRRPLNAGVHQVAGQVADRARLTTPFEAVKNLQSSLNSHTDVAARPFPPLKEDGVPGPKTSRALTFATKRLGSRGLLSSLLG
ncbi:MAG: hypothetical protein HQ501_00825 [Rhodospirillales bacterium]|nr:hypothetical protein [Rhodospirillales bacterium]